MESVESTLEKIKNDEINKERLLKEKRELEATKASINKAIRDTVALTEKSSLQQLELVKTTEKLKKELKIEIIRRDSLSALHNTLSRELEQLRLKSNEGISNIWDLRTSLCNQTYSTSDCYDIWALLKKPAHTEPSICKINVNPLNDNIIIETEKRLIMAIERRSKAIAERDRLLHEPENGVKFLRIKNALKYSLEKIADLRN